MSTPPARLKGSGLHYAKHITTAPIRPSIHVPDSRGLWSAGAYPVSNAPITPTTLFVSSGAFERTDSTQLWIIAVRREFDKTANSETLNYINLSAVFGESFEEIKKKFRCRGFEIM